MPAASVQTLRGFACLLLVAYHAVGSAPDRGLMLGDGSVLRHLVDSFVYLRMPLFAFIAGYVYGLRPVQAGSLRPFIVGKGRRLLVPMAVVGTLVFLTDLVHEGELSLASLAGIWQVYFVRYEHFWYLQSLFLIFALVGMLDAGSRLADRRTLALCLAAAALASAAIPEIRLFSLSDAFYLLPHFLLGLLASRSADLLRSTAARATLLVVMALGLLLTQAGLLGWLAAPVARHALAATLFGWAACLLLWRSGWQVGALQRIGRYSYPIYLFHVFGTTGARAVLQKLGLSATWPLFASSVVAGVALPILLRHLIGDRPVPRLLLFGERPGARSGQPAAALALGRASV